MVSSSHATTDFHIETSNFKVVYCHIKFPYTFFTVKIIIHYPSTNCSGEFDETTIEVRAFINKQILKGKTLKNKTPALNFFH